MPSSYNRYAVVPSAIISDGSPLIIPIYAVTQMVLEEVYKLPAIGSTGAKSIVSSHDDTIQLTGLLLGPERYTFKLLLETLAEASKRGSALGAFTGGRFSGLILITSMTIRTDMQVQKLRFTASSAKRDALDVFIEMVHVPLPSALTKLFDAASIGIGALADWGGN